MKFGSGFPSKRPLVMTREAMVATSQPLAVSAALRMLQVGGNAVDAAVAAAAMLVVVDPRSTGLGGDGVALIFNSEDRRLHSLNATGRAPLALTGGHLRQKGETSVPREGPLSITVPGLLDGWSAMLERFGNLGLDTVLVPAIDCATSGFPVTPEVSSRWIAQEGKLIKHSGPDCSFLVNGLAPRAGEVFRNPELAATLRTLANEGTQGFYRGALASKICEQVQHAGGVLQEEDLLFHKSDWAEPIGAEYRNHVVYEPPPNSQGLAVLLTLGIVEGIPLHELGHNSARYVHILLEALKLAYEQASLHVADPSYYPVPLDELISSENFSWMRKQVHENRPRRPEMNDSFFGGDTVYVSVVDPHGNVVSLMNSVFSGFGSGIVVPGTGIVLQNRAAGFRLEEGHPNSLEPNKRPYHTIIPGMIFRDGRPWASLGVIGGLMQPQGQVQVICNLIDFEMDPQAALDGPRFRYMGGLGVALEPGLAGIVAKSLRDFGHEIEDSKDVGFGGGQLIVMEGGALIGGSDPRKDGIAAGF